MLGPVQVLVVGVPDASGGRAVLDGLDALADDAPVRVLDAFELTADDDGELDVPTDGSGRRGWSVGFFTQTHEDSPNASAEETWQLGDAVPPGTRAVVALLEHRWASGLRDSMVAAGGALRFESWLDELDRDHLDTLLAERED